MHRPVQPLCIVTNKEAKYLDPVTGLPYRGSAEFKTLRRLMGQGDPASAAIATTTTKAGGSASMAGNSGSTAPGPVWSSLLGAYVGAGGRRRLPNPETATSSEETVESIRWRSARTVSAAFVGGKVEVEEKMQIVAPVGHAVGGAGGASSNATANVGGTTADVKTS